MGVASSLAPSYGLAFKKTRAAPSSLPPSARPPRTARERANGPAFPPMQKSRTSSRRASSTPIARKRAPRMTPLQTSSDLLGRRLGKAWSGVLLGADWEGAPFRAPERALKHRLRRASGAASWSGVLPGADWERAPFRAPERAFRRRLGRAPERAPERAHRVSLQAPSEKLLNYSPAPKTPAGTIRSLRSFSKRAACPGWGYSSVGRAPALQAGGRRFESDYLHHFHRSRHPTSFAHESE